MKYEILSEQGEVINTIVATPEFIEAQFPGAYREVYEQPTPTDPVALQAEIVQATQQRLDAFAQTKTYDNMLSACTYATSTVPLFRAEGQYCVEARDATWAKLVEILAEVESGVRPVPQGFAEIEGELPVLSWPA